MLLVRSDQHLLKVFQRLFDLADTVFVDGVHRKVSRRDKVIVKLGPDARGYEADALRFVRQETTIPVPKVYGGLYVPRWNLCCHSRIRRGSASSLRCGRLALLRRSCKSANSFGSSYRSYERNDRLSLGGIGDAAAIDARKFTLTSGHFTTEEPFNAFLRSDLFPAARRRYRLMFQEIIGSNRDIVLTHGDLNWRNILVHDNEIKAAIDCEYAGWVQKYWEYVKFSHEQDKSGLETYVDKIFP
ncbi:hypothetical protein FOPE_10712 [Fonsecaea pedrosoi]|nr:hypothetical protein FOPE_10712 [Fonsecaea pedrosoi]